MLEAGSKSGSILCLLVPSTHLVLVRACEFTGVLAMVVVMAVVTATTTI